MIRVLLGESILSSRQLIETTLKSLNYEVVSVLKGDDLEEAFVEHFDILILDSRFAGKKLKQFLTKANVTSPDLKIILTQSQDFPIQVHVNGFKGICEIVQKPFTTKQLCQIVQRVCPAGAKQNLSTMAKAQSEYFKLEDLPSIKTHPGMKKAVGLILSVAQSDITVLISGESGVGKEIFARTLHDLSLRKSKQQIALNCASVPPTLLESELFGSERGAFTGSTTRRLGKFEQAQKSTLLLDEVSEMDLDLQVKLLRVIQEKELYRVGGDEKIKLDVRLVATTNRDLQNWMKQGNFREDLFYRLNVININVPPLRERLEDVPVLAQHFLNKLNRENPGRQLELTEEAIDDLCRYDWPGNIRELENILLRSAFLSKMNKINKISFDAGRGPQDKSTAASTFFKGTLEEMERQMIFNALEIHDGNRMRAADQLGISVRTLRNKLRIYRQANILPAHFDHFAGIANVSTQNAGIANAGIGNAGIGNAGIGNASIQKEAS